MTQTRSSVAHPLVFVRHGETDWNVAGRLQGRTDTPLNPRGRDQAAAVGRSLASAFPDIAGRDFVSSPLRRASHTMRLMRGAMGLDAEAFTTDGRLAEMSFGRWEGSTFRELRQREPEAMRERDADRWTHRAPGGESYADVVARIAPLLAGFTAPTVVVSHGAVARAVLRIVAGMSRDELPDLFIRQGRAIVFESCGWRWL